VTPYWRFPVASMFLTLVLMVSLIGWTSNWGLPSVGSQWGTGHWAAFGIAFTLLFAIAIMAARTSWDTPLIRTLSGIAVAMPLILTAWKPRRHQ
jgi:hypothetical protein